MDKLWLIAVPPETTLNDRQAAHFFSTDVPIEHQFFTEYSCQKRTSQVKLQTSNGNCKLKTQNSELKTQKSKHFDLPYSICFFVLLFSSGLLTMN
jgi:hypothetical protein